MSTSKKLATPSAAAAAPTPMEQDDEGTKRAIAEMRSEIRLSALEIITRRMPKKVIALDRVYKTDPRMNVPLAEIERMFRDDWARQQAQLQGGAKVPKKRKLDEPDTTATATAAAAAATTATEETAGGVVTASTVSVPCNRVIMVALDMLRTELLELIEQLNTVKMWIQLNIPRIEDGNNFGVNVQEETVAELGRAEEAAFSAFENMTKYHITRAKLVCKCVKYPLLPDYQTAVAELDQKEYINVRLTLLDVRNNWSILYDMILKNLEKIKNPRSGDHTERLY
jgi:hypothetical protein